MLSVSDMMIRDPVVVAPHAKVAEAARIMNERRINSVVVATDGRVEGVLTPRDLLALATDGGSGDTPVRDLMTPDPFTIPADASFATAAELMDARHVRHLPVVEGDRLVGMLSVRDLMQHRTEHLEEVVEQQTAALRTTNQQLRDRERTMQYHLDLAGRIQRQFLPHDPPRLSPFSVDVVYRPLESVSGDCYDFMELPEHRLGILIADASGHGVPAAFISIMARTLFQAYGNTLDTPADVLRMMNERLPPLIEEEHFITMCQAAVDPRTLELTYATGGHPPPLLYRSATGDVEGLAGSGHMVGVLEEPTFAEHTAQLEPGDMVLFYTDGIVEARNLQGRQFGTDHLASLLRLTAADASLDVAQAIQAKVLEHCGPRGPNDDLTCIALRIDPIY